MLNEQIIIQTDGLGNKKQKYIKKQKIGSGGFAKCYMLVNCKTKQKFAAKVIDSRELRDKSTRFKIHQQIQIHKQLDHPHVVRFYDTFEFEDQIYMIMQLCQNNTLKQFIKTRVRITEFQAKYYLHQIIQGLQYIHNLNIIHRDIKLGNLFLNLKMEVKIGDFGLSRQLKQPRQRRYTTCGTPNYIAPQILKQTGHSYEADVWALGVIMYAMLIGKPPFQSQSVQQTYRKIKSNTYQFPKQIPISNQAKALIRSILDPNPRTRITLQQIKKHEFMNKDTQKIPKNMPAYTISIPPQNNFLKQYINEKSMKLLVYPKRIIDRRSQFMDQDDKTSKLDRVLSADKKMILKLQLYKSQNSKQVSSLNRGRYLKALRTQSLPKNKQLKGVRSAASMGSSLLFNMEPLVHKFNSPNTKRQSQQDLNQIICYYDISDKYGTAYLLSNGNFGIIFNDQTSITCVQDLENKDQFYIYNDKKQIKFREFPEHLNKKKQILKICENKLSIYRRNNILVPYKSETYAKKFIKLNQGFVIKLSNSIMQFFWGADSITLRNYKWIRWRINQSQGEGQLGQKIVPQIVKQKYQEVRDFLLRCSLNTKTRNQNKV